MRSWEHERLLQLQGLLLLGHESAQNALPGTLGTLVSQTVTLCPRLVLYPLMPLYLVIMSVSPHYHYSARLLSLMQEVAANTH